MHLRNLKNVLIMIQSITSVRPSLDPFTAAKKLELDDKDYHLLHFVKSKKINIPSCSEESHLNYTQLVNKKK